jgi:cytochrome c biogenesis protein
MAGLGRSESAKVPEELGDLAGILYDLAPGATTEPDPKTRTPTRKQRPPPPNPPPYLPPKGLRRG